MCAVVGESWLWEKEDHKTANVNTSSLGTVHGYKYKPQVVPCCILQFVLKGTAYLNKAQTWYTVICPKSILAIQKVKWWDKLTESAPKFL